MYRQYRFGPVQCEMQDFFSEMLWSMCQWKLDAYEIPLREAGSASLHIRKSFGVHLNDYPHRVCDERSGFFSRQVFQNKKGDMIWRLVWTRDQVPVLVYKMSSDWREITVLEDHTNTAGQAMFEFMSRMVLYAMIPLSVVSFHGVLLEYQGKGIILTAPSGTGKTTHARLWRDSFGAFVINGDNACCYKKQGVWTGFGIPWCGTSGENMNREVEIIALVVLNQAVENHVKKLTEYEAFLEVLPMLQHPAWDSKMTELALNGMEEILRDIPVYFLDCCPDMDSVRLLKSRLEV